MTNKHPQYKIMLEHCLLCFNDEYALVDECLHRLTARSGLQKDEVVTMVNNSRREAYKNTQKQLFYFEKMQKSCNF